jgi:mannose-6-phosphate isomerase-like protein (cupin superfamily)
MNIQIRSLDEHNLGQVNQGDNGFQVENKLCLHVNHEEIHYSIVHAKKFEKRYPSEELDYASYIYAWAKLPRIVTGSLILMDKINLIQKFSLFNDYWQPKIIGELNDAYIKLVKLKGEFVWHQHATEDELFLVIKGRLRILLRDGEVNLEPGELVIIPRGVEHCPVAEEEAQVVLMESKTTLNTGEVQNDRTAASLKWI